MTPENLPFLVERLQGAHKRLVSETLDTILRAWQNVANRFLSVLRAKGFETVAAATGFHETDIRRWLNHLLVSVADENRAYDWISRELYRSTSFEIPYRSGGLITIQKGCERALVIQGGGIPLTALPVVIALTLARTPVAVRTGRHDSVSWPLLVLSARRASDLLADSILPVSFSHADPEFVSTVLTSFPLIVAYGSNESLAEMSKHIVPPQRFIGFGSRFSLAWLSKSCLALSLRQDVANRDSLVRKLARDVLIFNKRGCYSVQGVMVESRSNRGLQAFCKQLLAALRDELAVRRRYFSAGTALAVRTAIAHWAQYGIRQVFFPKQESYPAVVLMEGSRLPPPSDGLVVWISPVESIENAIPLLRPYRDYLSTLVVAGSPRESLKLFQSFSRLGFTRFCEPGCAQFPDIFAPHDGIPLLSAVSITGSAEW